MTKHLNREEMTLTVALKMKSAIRTEGKYWHTQSDIKYMLAGVSPAVAFDVIAYGLSSGFFIARDADDNRQRILVALSPSLR